MDTPLDHNWRAQICAQICQIWPNMVKYAFCKEGFTDLENIPSPFTLEFRKVVFDDFPYWLLAHLCLGSSIRPFLFFTDAVMPKSCYNIRLTHHILCWGPDLHWVEVSTPTSSQLCEDDIDKSSHGYILELWNRILISLIKVGCPTSHFPILFNFLTGRKPLLFWSF